MQGNLRKTSFACSKFDFCDIKLFFVQSSFLFFVQSNFLFFVQSNFFCAIKFFLCNQTVFYIIFDLKLTSFSQKSLDTIIYKIYKAKAVRQKNFCAICMTCNIKHLAQVFYYFLRKSIDQIVAIVKIWYNLLFFMQTRSKT